jgi:lipoprotein-releasing system ATP-binding protein
LSSHTPIIVATDLLKSYQSLTVLDVPYLEIESGVITSIVGPSGAGKSTLLHILGTLLKPSSGTIAISGSNITELNDVQISSFRNQNLGFVFQSHNLLPEFSALENVSLPAMIAGEEKKLYEERARELLDFIGLGSRYHHKPSQLSGGEQQRVAIARALINSPKLILADEPTGNLDTKNAMDIHDLFLKLRNEKGYTFLIVTHNPELAKKSDRTIEMCDGKIIS